MAKDELESEPEVEVRTDVLGNVFRRGDRVLITDGPQLGQIGRIAKLFADFAMIELKSKEFVRVECKDLQLTAQDGPLGALGAL